MVAPGCSGGKAGHQFVANGATVVRHLINLGLISPQYGGCSRRHADAVRDVYGGHIHRDSSCKGRNLPIDAYGSAIRSRPGVAITVANREGCNQAVALGSPSPSVSHGFTDFHLPNGEHRAAELHGGFDLWIDREPLYLSSVERVAHAYPVTVCREGRAGRRRVVEAGRGIQQACVTAPAGQLGLRQWAVRIFGRG